MVEHAAAKGLTEVCITSHYDANVPKHPGFDFNLDFDAYVPDVLQCAKAYEHRIAVKLGVEVGIKEGDPSVIPISSENIQKWPFDFVIASSHFLQPPNYHDQRQWIENNATKAQVQARYLSHTLNYVQSFDDFDVLGHLTYFSRYSPANTAAEREMTYEDNRALYDELFTQLIRRGKGIEINTSTKEKFGFFSPDYSIAKRFYQMGGRIITVGSDAHVPHNIGAYYGEALEMLGEAGFKAICTFDKRQPAFWDIQGKDIRRHYPDSAG